MLINKIKPKTLTYRLTMEREDTDYYKCMWAEFLLDLDAYRLTIYGDFNGEYSYCWGANEHETFISLMSRIGEDYLLNKISSRSQFVLSESKSETLRYMESFGYEYFGIKSEEAWESVRDEILNMHECTSEEAFFEGVNAAVPKIDFEDICIVKDYPKDAKLAAYLFIRYMQPIFKEMQAEGTSND